MARMTEKIKLPSNGLLYGGRIPADLTIQNLTTDEEAMLYSSSGSKAIDNIVKSIVKEDIDIDALTIFDRHFILMKGRILTYGPNYPIEVTCPRDGKFHYEVDLNTLPVYELEEKYSKPWDTEALPQCKTVLTLSIPTGRVLSQMEQDIKRKVAKFGLIEDRVRYIANIAVNIVGINGENASFEEAYQFVSKLSGMDSSFLKKEINKVEAGYDTMIFATCPKCGNEIEIRLPMTVDFFRTEF